MEIYLTLRSDGSVDPNNVNVFFDRDKAIEAFKRESGTQQTVEEISGFLHADDWVIWDADGDVYYLWTRGVMR